MKFLVIRPFLVGENGLTHIFYCKETFFGNYAENARRDRKKKYSSSGDQVSTTCAPLS